MPAMFTVSYARVSREIEKRLKSAEKGRQGKRKAERRGEKWKGVIKIEEGKEKYPPHVVNHLGPPNEPCVHEARVDPRAHGEARAVLAVRN
jgi:hypothetical protein